jgi:saccharopine dehydrogenase (NAD+, L-lysine forming)
MKTMRIGIIREGKIPQDYRVALTPMQCLAVQKMHPNLKIVVQTSPVRAYNDEEYASLGIDIVDDLADCDVIFGIKEVPIENLIPNKVFFFFSHTIKKQPFNRLLLKSILAKKIQLVDYELIRDVKHSRLIGFGRYAGIVGCYNAFLTYGLKSGRYSLKPAHTCHDRKEVEAELKKVNLPNDFRVVLTGFGRVGHGAAEIMKLLPIKEITAAEFLTQTFNYPVFTQLESGDYYANTLNEPFDKKHFYKHPEHYISTFNKYLPLCDMYIPCHFWDSRSPKIIEQADLNMPNRRIKVIADISCDTAGPIASTIRSSKISSPIYGYDPATGLELDFMDVNAIAVMAVDNLPCELPRDASEHFGDELIKIVVPILLGDDPENILERASETNKLGELMPDFSYLSDYVSD